MLKRFKPNFKFYLRYFKVDYKTYFRLRKYFWNVLNYCKKIKKVLICKYKNWHTIVSLQVNIQEHEPILKKNITDDATKMLATFE